MILALELKNLLKLNRFPNKFPRIIQKGNAYHDPKKTVRFIFKSFYALGFYYFDTGFRISK